MTGVLIKRGKFGHRHTGRTPCEDRNTQTQKENSHVKIEAEIGVMLLQTKDCLGLPGAGKLWEGPSPSGFGANMALPTPYFGLLASRTVIE